jgi:hypothetical protein
MQQSQDGGKENETMADAKTPEQQVQDLQAQLTEYQGKYREALKDRYDLDPVTADLILPGTAEQMEKTAQSLKRITTTPRQQLEQEAQSPNGENKSGTGCSEAANNYMERFYPGPAGMGGKK